MADSPHPRGGQSATVPESLQSLWWARGRSGPGGRTVRHFISKVVPERVSLWWGFKVERRTVHPWGADGPPANLSFVPERLFLWFGLKSELRTVRPWGTDGQQANSVLDQRACLSLVKTVLLTADGPPLGRGRSAGV